MKILVAEDDNVMRRKLEKLLVDMGYEVVSCKDGLEAWEAIQADDAPNLLLLDWMMPGMDGVELCRKVRELAREPYAYILLLTSKDKQDDIVEGMDAGADGYITKPFNQQELKARLKSGLRITELNEELLGVRNELQKETVHDSLTGLYNRRYMAEILENEFARTSRYQTDLSCILFDLDFFKNINDTYGHAFGDLVLREFSANLKQLARQTDIPIRYGGEEFMLLLTNTDIDGARNLAEKIRSASEKKTFNDGTNSTTATVSMGVASVKKHKASDGKELVAFADKALYRAKAEGRNRVKVYIDDSPGQNGDGDVSEGKDFRYLKENLASILEKTKKASVESVELLVRDAGNIENKQHNQKVKQYIEFIGERLILPPSIIETFKRAATLHDNFQILLEKTLKNKSDELDTAEQAEQAEQAEIEAYPYMLSELVELFDFFTNEKSILLYHHENFDGSGYPDGLKENEIPLGARIFAIADAIADMLSGQTHRKKLSPEEAIEELVDKAGKQFDPKLVSLFFDIIEQKELFPVSAEVLNKSKEKVRAVMVS